MRPEDSRRRFLCTLALAAASLAPLSARAGFFRGASGFRELRALFRHGSHALWARIGGETKAVSPEAIRRDYRDGCFQLDSGYYVADGEWLNGKIQTEKGTGT